jgi:hypothetical protein
MRIHQSSSYLNPSALMYDNIDGCEFIESVLLSKKQLARKT